MSQIFKTAEKLEKCADIVRQAKERSPETYDTVSKVLQGYSAKHGTSILDAAVKLSMKTENAWEHLWLLGTAALLIEESTL